MQTNKVVLVSKKCVQDQANRYMAKKQIKKITDTILFFTIQLHMKKYEGTYVIKGVEKKATRNRHPVQLKK